MSALNSLKQLVASLTDNELSLCHSYLQAFDRRGEKHENKSRKLLTLLKNQPSYKEYELIYLIYGSDKSTAFSRLLLRLKDKILEAVTLPVANGQHEKVSEHRKVLSGIHVRLHQTEFLIERNLLEIVRYQLAYVCEVSEVHEFFAEHLQALSYLAKISPKEQGQLFRKLRKTRNYWQYEVTCHELFLLAELADPAETEKQLTELRQLEQSCGSARASFLLLETEALITTKNRNYERAVLIRRRQLRLIENHRALQDGDKIRAVYLKLAELNFRLLRLTQTIDFVQYGLPLCISHTDKRRKLLEIETAACFLQNNPAPGLAAITEALMLQPTTLTYYLHALILFQQGKYSEAIDVMERINWKAADRENFGTTARVFMQILHIENEPEPGERSIIRKLKSLDNKMPMAIYLNPREQLIVDLIQALITSNLHFKLVYQEYRGHIEQLRATKGTTAWTLDRWELIVFQEWLVSKTLGVPYKFV